MIKESDFQLYAGDGTRLSARGRELPQYEYPASLDAPEFYIAEKGLRDAVNVALALGQPLLVTGEPGTGKTQLASSIAHELDLPEPLVFHTKTTSTARDLFYHYDAMRHFHDSQFQSEDPPAERYITYDVLGRAVLLSWDREEANPLLPEHLKDKGPVRSVVLIDEIDKAPRDLPNDLLNEIVNLSFTVKETERTFVADPGYRPILVLTSNSEKNLPDAFLRRCVFYNIPFPAKESLVKIVRKRLSLDDGFTAGMLENAIKHFEDIRGLALKKKPATAELLAWIRVLEGMKIDVNNLTQDQADALAITYSVLIKSREDMELLERFRKEKAALR